MIRKDNMSTESESTPIPVLNWPNDLPGEGDSFFSIFCDSQDLCWVFHKPDGTMIQWRTTHITEVNEDDLLKELVLLFPPESEPLRYIFGSEKKYTFPSALKQSKLYKSSCVHVYYLDDTIELDKDCELTDEDKEQQRRNETYASQLNLLAKLWSAIPFKGYKVDVNTFIGSSDTLPLKKDRLTRLTTQTIATYILADVHFCQPIMTVTKSRHGDLSYIGSFELGSDNDDNQNYERNVIIAGTLRLKSSDQEQDRIHILNQLDKVMTRWKSTMQNTNDSGDEDSIPAIILGNDRNNDLESQIQSMLLLKSKKHLYDFSHFPCPIAHCMDHLIVNGREKAERIDNEKERAERQEKARVAKERFEASQKNRGSETLKRKAQSEEERRKKTEDALKKKKHLVEEKRKKAEEYKRKREYRRRKKSDKPNKAKTDPKSFVGVKIAKEFVEGVFTGEVTAYFNEEKGEEPLWHVVYEDSDEEDFNEKELMKAIDLFTKTVSSRGRKIP